VTLEDRTRAFHRLGHQLRNLSAANKDSLLNEAKQFNAWFAPEQVNLALANVSRLLDYDKLIEWTSRYSLTRVGEFRVGVVMAGNIPLVGFHDMMSVLLSGHFLVAKPSSQDTFLINYVIEGLIEADPRFKERIACRERLNDVDAVIATGSDNTARYFEYYFRNIPHLIRKNRSSCAILTGDESAGELDALAIDIFSFYGLGCRNVSKVFVPEGYDIRALFPSLQSFEHLINHHKYANNYDYNKSIMLVNGTTFLDNGFALVTESQDLVSPISVIYYERYADHESLQKRLTDSASKIQCIVGSAAAGANLVPFGKAQYPELDDYADKVDTMEFLTSFQPRG
jgi:hypothetical protein